MISIEVIQDRAYLHQLAREDCKGEASPEDVISGLEHNLFIGWYCLENGIRKGVIFVLLSEDGKFIFEALKDRSAGFTGIQASLECANMAFKLISRITHIIYAYARVQDRAIQFVVSRLGFAKEGIVDLGFGDWFLYKKELSCQQLPQLPQS